MIFDTHAHYDDEAFEEDREEVLGSLTQAGIGRVVNVGSSLVSCESTIELARKYSYIYAAVGVHPSETAELDEKKLEWLRSLCREEKCVAVGEIGLDYHWDDVAPAVQKEWFARQLFLAQEADLPVIIHSREALKDTIDIMKAQHAEKTGGVIHCYSYTKESAAAFLDMGFYFGIGGVITFKNGKKLKETVEYLPMDRIVIETDCPYLSPEPNRGKRNSSLNLTYVLEAIAAIRRLTVKETEQITWENACRLYRMEEN